MDSSFIRLMGITRLENYAERRGHTVKIIDRNIKANSHEIKDAYKPDVVGI